MTDFRGINGDPHPQVPPEGQDLEFVENTKTGTVHILPAVDGEPALLKPGEIGEAITGVLLGPGPPMLCGYHLKHTWPGAPGQFITVFRDGKLCRACVHALGDQSARAFEHPRPDGDDPGIRRVAGEG